MKKLALALLLAWFPSFSQTYVFDYVASYEVEHWGGKMEIVKFVNSGNYNYNMLFLKGSARNGSIKVMVVDRQINEYHIFDATENDGKEIHSFDFTYKGSKKMVKDSRRKRLEKMVTDITPGADSLTANLVVYKNDKRKNVVTSATLQLARSSKNFMPLIKFFLFDGILNYQQITYSNDVVVERATVAGKDGEPESGYKYVKKFVRPIKLSVTVSRKVYRDGDIYNF